MNFAKDSQIDERPFAKEVVGVKQSPPKKTDFVWSIDADQCCIRGMKVCNISFVLGLVCGKEAALMLP